MHDTDATDSFWRSLAFFSWYRLAVALVFLFAVGLYSGTLNLSLQDAVLFLRINLSYVLAAVIFLLALWRRRLGFDLQLSVQVLADVGFLTALMYAAGGQKSGIAVMLLVVVAAAGLVGQGRLTLFYAAVASVAILLEQSWRALALDGDPADFVRTGLTCVGFFGTAITARLLASRVVANEQLARRRGAELDRQLRINERIIRDMSAGIIVTDIDGRVRQLNPAATRLLGINLAGCSLHELGADFMAQFREWAATPGGNVTVIRAPSGRALRVRYMPAEDAPGNGLLYLEDLDQVQVQAQQLKLAALGRLTANIAHEIRNPLAAISHAAELMGEDATDPLRIRLARIVGDNTRRLNKLVTDVLELGRRDRAEPEVLHWRVCASTLVEELTLHDPGAGERILVQGEDVSIVFDRGHLHRVLWNLTTNALRHANAEPGSIRLGAVPVDGGERVAIHVDNDGPGISAELRNQVFEPFFTTRSTGTGLGLYIARELCEANGAVLELLDTATGVQFRIMAKGVR